MQQIRNTPPYQILIVAPYGRDAAAAAMVLQEAGHLARPLTSVSELCACLNSPVGAILIAEEALTVESAEELKSALLAQEKWSAIPIILMTSEAERIFSAEKILDVLSMSGAISILERPFKIVTLVAALSVAMKTRERQYQVRDLLNQQQIALKQRDEFLSIASHELKTPMTTLKLQVQSRQRRLDRGDFSVYSPEKVASLLKMADTQINRLTRLVEDMLDISRIVNGKLSLNLTRIELGPLIQEVIDNFVHEFERAGCQIDTNIHGNVFVNCDGYRIEQVISNLFTNAIKYGEGKTVSLSLSKANNKAYLKVTDNGIGIDPENLDRIFNRFERAVDATAISGLGLGLYISRQILQMHEGKISVESIPGEGSTFTVELPAL